MSDEQPRRGFQFGLRQLIGTMVVLSVVFALLFAAPNWVDSTAVIVIAPLAIAVLTTAIVYGQGDLRAFCIGALCPAAMASIPVVCVFVDLVFTSLGFGYDYMIRQLAAVAAEMRTALVTGVVLSPVAGILSVIVRRCLARDE